MFTFRKGHKKLDMSATRPAIDTRDEIEVILDSVEGEVGRILEDGSPPPQKVSLRDVLEGRARSDSFYDAETEFLPASLVTPTTPPSSLSPFMVSRPPEPPAATELVSPAPPPPLQEGVSPRSSSGPWLMVLFAAACTAGFLAYLERPAPPRAPAIAPPAATPLAAPPAVVSETDASALGRSADSEKPTSTRDE